MCGICGIVNIEKKPIEKRLLKDMCDAMSHRGPDGEGIYIYDNQDGFDSKINAGLGHRRLSIIDLSKAGNQPMCNEDESIWLVLNGEIYNYCELRVGLEKKGHRFKSKADSEVVIHLYEDYGEDCVTHLSGMFAFAIWDEKKGSLMLARDRPGKKPLLYSYTNGTFVFASEFASLLSSGSINKNINYEAIDYYLSFGYIPAPLTIYKNVFKLVPAHLLVFKEGDIMVKKYWELNYVKKVRISENEADEEVLRLLKDAVKKRLQSDVPVGAFLSGGVDSSAVVGLMAELSNRRVKTFSIGFDDSRYNELDHASRIAKHFDTEHHEFVVTPNALEILPTLVERYGEPYADSSAIPTYYVSRQTREHVTVALNGDGADEVFAGYDRYQAMCISGICDKVPLRIKHLVCNFLVNGLPSSIDPKNKWNRIKRFVSGVGMSEQERYRFWIGIFSDKLKESLYTEEFKKKTMGIDYCGFMGKYFNNKEIKSIDKVLSVDTNTYLPNDLLVKVDIASMANSLEARSPFLDHQLMEFAASLPANYKIKRFQKKYILKKTVSKLLPYENINRKKMGFGVPIGKWFRNDLKSFVLEILLSRGALNRGYFEPHTINKFVNDHVKGVCDHSSQLWALLMLELWHRKFMD